MLSIKSEVFFEIVLFIFILLDRNLFVLCIFILFLTLL